MLGLEDDVKGFVVILLAGPFLTGFTQTIKDWYDRDIDAINEPYRLLVWELPLPMTLSPLWAIEKWTSTHFP